MTDLAEQKPGWQIDEGRGQALQAAFAAAVSYQSWRQKFLDGARRRYGWLALILLVSNMALVGTVSWLVPAQRLVPVLLVVQPDGTIDSMRRIQDLPPTTEVAVVRATLWHYIKARESFTWANTPERYQFVSSISAKSVRETYQKWMDFKNAASPQRLGHTGNIIVERISLVLKPSNVAVARFRRTIEREGQPPQVSTWTAALDFTLSDRVPVATRDDGDPGGIVVTGYSSSEDTP